MLKGVVFGADVMHVAHRPEWLILTAPVGVTGSEQDITKLRDELVAATAHGRAAATDSTRDVVAAVAPSPAERDRLRQRIAELEADTEAKREQRKAAKRAAITAIKSGSDADATAAEKTVDELEDAIRRNGRRVETLKAELVEVTRAFDIEVARSRQAARREAAVSALPALRATVESICDALGAAVAARLAELAEARGALAYFTEQAEAPPEPFEHTQPGFAMDEIRSIATAEAARTWVERAPLITAVPQPLPQAERPTIDPGALAGLTIG
jgi:DNA repair exonuclease SbcCD ATPase subunit